MAKQDINKIMYICDRRACETCSEECTLTADIQHARNFEKSGDYFIEITTSVSNVEIESPRATITRIKSLNEFDGQFAIVGVHFEPLEDFSITYLFERNNKIFVHTFKQEIGKKVSDTMRQIWEKHNIRPLRVGYDKKYSMDWTKSIDTTFGEGTSIALDGVLSFIDKSQQIAVQTFLQFRESFRTKQAKALEEQ